jgi:TRAP-type transport system small permease protein
MTNLASPDGRLGEGRRSNLIKKALGTCENVLLYCAGTVIVLMMLLTSADAAGRYLFNTPITGAYEITEKYLMVLTLFGVCYAYRKGSYVRLTFAVDLLPRSMKGPVNYLVQGISIFFSLLLLVNTGAQTLRVAAAKSIVDVRGWSMPLWPAYAIIPLGLFFLLVAMVLDLPGAGKGKSDLFREGEEEL